MRPIPLTPLIAAVRMLNVPNVSTPSRDLVMLTLCFVRAAFLTARFSRRLFRANALRLLFSSRGLPRLLLSFFRRVGCSIPTTSRLLHRRHFCLLVCDLRAFLLSSLRVPRFLWRRCTAVAAGNDFALLGCITTSQCCCRVCTVSINEFSYQSTSCRDIHSYENFMPIAPSKCCCRLPRRRSNCYQAMAPTGSFTLRWR